MISRSLRWSFSNFKRHPLLHFFSIFTTSIALTIVGIFFLVYQNVSYIAKKADPQIIGTAYLQDGLSVDAVRSLKERILGLAQVQNVEFKSKQKVVEEIYSFIGDTSGSQGPGSDLFPDVIEVAVTRDISKSALELVRQVIQRLPGVAEVDFSEDWLSTYHRIKNVLMYICIGILAAVLIGCSFMVANFMGMRHQSRRQEIEIVRLVGAGSSFVMAPFMLEALIEGVIGSTLSIVVLIFFRTLAITLCKMHFGPWFAQEAFELGAMQIGCIFIFGCSVSVLSSLLVFFRFRENQI